MRNFILNFIFFFQAEDGIRDLTVTGVQTVCSSDLVEQLVRLISEDRLKVKVYTRNRLHAKAYIFDYPTDRFERSEEHTSELQSQSNLVCRLLLEKKKILLSLLEHKLQVAGLYLNIT